MNLKLSLGQRPKVKSRRDFGIHWVEGDCFDIGLIFNIMDKSVNFMEPGQFLGG